MDVNAIVINGQTSLHGAAQADLTNSIEALLDVGAIIDASDNDGRTPLHLAAGAGSIGAIHELLYRGANANASDKEGRTPLHNATRGSVSALPVLLNGGADVNATDKDGRTPLYHAALFGLEDSILLSLSSRSSNLFSIKYKGNLGWEGLDTYQNCDGAIGDNLTISRLNHSQDHCYIARSVKEFLIEYYPIYGLEILSWITKICEQCPEVGSDQCGQ